MPPLPNAPNVVKLNVEWQVKGDALAQTIHFFKFTGPASTADLSSMANFAVSAGESSFQALADDSSGMLQATARDLSSDMGNEATAGTAWVGTRGTALLPPAASAVVSHSISRHYRGGHPRSYLPLGVSGDVATTGLWATAFVTATESAWGNWVSALIESYGSLVITNIVNVSYFGPPNRIITNPVTGRARTVSTLRGTPIIDTITGHAMAKRIGSQRRRNRDA